MSSQDGRRPVISIPSHTDVYNDNQHRTSFFQPSNPSSSSNGDANRPNASSSMPITRTPLILPGRDASSAAGFPQSTVNTSAPPQSFANQGRSLGGGGNNSTFTEAFAFVKNTKFYEPPPPPASRSSGPPSTSAPFSTGGMAHGTTNSVTASSAAALQQNRNAIIVSKRQQGNPVLKHIRNVRWVLGDIVPDYLLGATACALYISLRYHLLHPDYLYFRIRELQRSFRLRVVLCHVDVEDVIKPLHEVTKTALINDCTLLCAWSVEECARYLETIKVYENKPADAIQERTDNDYISRLTSAVTSIRHVNKTDVLTLGANFGTLASMMQASSEDLAKCPGIGEKKVKRLHDTFHEPFRRTIRQKQLGPLLLGSSSAAKEGDAGKSGKTGAAEEGAEQEGKKPEGEEKKDEPHLSVKEALAIARATLPEKDADTEEDEEHIVSISEDA